MRVLFWRLILFAARQPLANCSPTVLRAHCCERLQQRKRIGVCSCAAAHNSTQTHLRSRMQVDEVYGHVY